MPVYTLEEIRKARDMATQLGLLGSGIFCLITEEEVQTICNGIGAAWMPEIARSLCDRRFDVMRIPAMIHDVQYEYGTGCTDDFKRANYNLYANGCIMAKHLYGWYNPLRYVVMNDARRLASICDVFGMKAYKEAIAHRKRRQEGGK